MQYNAIKERAKGPKKMKRKGKFIMTFYFSETTDTNSLKKALQLKATNLTAAKREASRKQVFLNSILTIGTAVNEDGFILPKHVLAVRSEDGKWENY